VNPTAPRSTSRTARGKRATQQLLRLAQGMPCLTLSAAEWDECAALAADEGLTAIIWRQSSAEIQRSAPADVAARWRRNAVGIALRGRAQFDALSRTVQALKADGLSPTVLKGIPLGQLIYGDYAVRPMVDCDLHLPLAERAKARASLSRVGWRWVSGEQPAEESFEMIEPTWRCRLEMHSTVLDDPLLPHIRIPTERADVVVEGRSVPAHVGRFVPCALAAHLAKHNPPRLLWILDFDLFWSRLTSVERSAAFQAASEIGLARHLRWAVRVSNALRSAGESPADLARIERLLRASWNARRVLRLILLSASPLDALRVLGGRIWPAEWRLGWREIPTSVLRRSTAWFYRHAAVDSTEDSGTASRTPGIEFSTEATHADSAAQQLRSIGAIWMRVSDGSMTPAVPIGAAARIVREREPVIGDVVLARRIEGEVFLSRLVHADDSSCSLRADSLQRYEVVPCQSILGVCDAVDVGGRLWKIDDRPRDVRGIVRALVGRMLNPRIEVRPGQR
jgi:putative nucleotidyltransferase-like protein